MGLDDRELRTLGIKIAESNRALCGSVPATWLLQKKGGSRVSFVKVVRSSKYNVMQSIPNNHGFDFRYLLLIPRQSWFFLVHDDSIQQDQWDRVLR